MFMFKVPQMLDALANTYAHVCLVMVGRKSPHKAGPLASSCEPLTQISVINLVNYSPRELFNHPSLFNLSGGPARQPAGLCHRCLYSTGKGMR